MQPAFETNTDGLVLKPSFHDGHLHGIRLEGRGGARLEITNGSGERFDLVITGISRLRANEFLEGNIVGELFLFTGAAVPLGKLEQLVPISAAGGEFLAQLQSECRAQNLILLEIESSYGCHLQVLCKSVTCVPAPPKPQAHSG